MNDQPLVSIIIPSYNHAQYIATAIDSVLAQTYPNIELIVIDDGSADESHQVIQRYADHPQVTAILNSENGGQGRVINTALGLAKGDFVGLLPSDDWYLPHKTALQVAKFLESGPEVGVVYAAGQRFFEDTGETLDVRLPVHTGWVADKLITEGNFVYPLTPLYRRAAFEKAMFEETFKAEGEAIFVRLALLFQFAYVDEVVAVMRDHSYNIGKDAEVMYDQIRLYWEWFFAQPNLPENIRSLKPVAMERLNRIKGLQFIADKRNFTKGRRCLVAAIRARPANLLNPRIAASLALSILPASLANMVLDCVKERPKV